MGDLMGRFNLNEWKKWVETDLSKNLKSTLNTYEQKVQGVVKDLDLRGKKARKKGEVHLEKWVKQLKRSRTDVEKRITTLVNGEATKLTRTFNDVMKNLRALSHSDKTDQKDTKVDYKAAAPTAKAKPQTAAKKKVSKKSPALKSIKKAKSGKPTEMSLGSLH